MLPLGHQAAQVDATNLLYGKCTITTTTAIPQDTRYTNGCGNPQASL
jgi:hypothetical protein